MEFTKDDGESMNLAKQISMEGALILGGALYTIPLCTQDCEIAKGFDLQHNRMQRSGPPRRAWSTPREIGCYL